ncbi:carbon-nitrogen hydrolase family protein [Tautonia marina]|uniref:carbon-nitrogen hydrolase family protein n=1 Tax=Tautonia marina TaxID=2653855 RepID=UPI001260A097|nr:carbon-nitrogen hydrolase family protein [Tautonia marina]
MFLAAAVQMNATADPEANEAQVVPLIERAAGYGARFVATPEHTRMLATMPEMVRAAEPLDGPTCQRFGALARRLGIVLLIGSINEQGSDPDRCSNTSVLFGPEGTILAVYRKIHLFDVDLSESVRSRESDHVMPGSVPVVARTPLARVGLSICYDLRFGNLYRRLVGEGAEVLCVPSAFTLTTGRAHWEVLIRARAIECQSFVIAPAQWGRHEDDSLRETFGHAMIVNPWGQVIATAADGPGLAIAEIDLDRVSQIRRAVPVANHFRPNL